MISKQEVQHIAKLARLGLNLTEVKKFQKELSKILDYIEKLKEVDVSKTEPASHSRRIENGLRSDETQNSKPKTQKLIALMPETKDGYLKVKKIIQEQTSEFANINN